MGIGNRANGSAHAPTTLQEKPRAAIPGWRSPSAKEHVGHPAHDGWARRCLRGRREPPNNGKASSGACKLASITGQGGKAAPVLVSSNAPLAEKKNDWQQQHEGKSPWPAPCKGYRGGWRRQPDHRRASRGGGKKLVPFAG